MAPTSRSTRLRPGNGEVAHPSGSRTTGEGAQASAASSLSSHHRQHTWQLQVWTPSSAMFWAARPGERHGEPGMWGLLIVCRRLCWRQTQK